MSHEFFPSIGDAVEQTDRLPDENTAGDQTQVSEEDRPLQEVESLCMSCGEQVKIFSSFCYDLLTSTFWIMIELRELPGCFSHQSHILKK
ncbi:hypothetical protein DL93DRAFT_2079095 [Clavulina sp. PMI_390]|nr:hypothetical protein DL93DRAFT_2079095 [Clavulina sp. PMI_390]